MYKAILVDDEILVRETISQNLDWEGLGYELVQECQNGQEAIDFIKENEVDLVLTDINMPYVTGLEVSQFVYEQKADTLVVIFSGYDEFQYAKKAMQYGVVDYLLKPVTPRELVQVLKDQKEKLDGKNQLQHVYQDYSRNKNLILSNELFQLVMGGDSTQKTLENLERQGLTFEKRNFCVLHLDLFLEGTTFDTVESKDSELVMFVIDNICSEVLKENGYGISFRDTMNSGICLLMYHNSALEFERVIADYSKLIPSILMEKLGIHTFIGIGSRVNQVEDLFDSYTNALKYRKYQFTVGREACWDYNEHMQVQEVSGSIELLLRKLEDMVDNRDMDGFVQMLRELMVVIKTANLENEKALYHVTSMVRTIYKSIKGIQGESKEELQKRDKIVTQILKSRSIEEAIVTVEEYANYVNAYVQELRSPKSERVAKSAITFLQNNYHNSELSLQDICDYVGVSTSHFSSMFKEATNETFHEALTRIRMNHAMKLLRETVLKSYEVAEKVGYNDSHYFAISFKKYTGMTPKNYAKEKREE